MKLTMTEVEAKLTAAWKRKVFVVPYRLAGNRYTYTATDHVDHRLPLETSWDRRGQVFQPAEGDWPEPEPLSWEDAVFAASQMAMAHFADKHNKATLKRLPRALVIAEARQWTRAGEELDTWLIPSLNRPDYEHNGVPAAASTGWRGHRQSRPSRSWRTKKRPQGFSVDKNARTDATCAISETSTLCRAQNP